MSEHRFRIVVDGTYDGDEVSSTELFDESLREATEFHLDTELDVLLERGTVEVTLVDPRLDQDGS